MFFITDQGVQNAPDVSRMISTRVGGGQPVEVDVSIITIMSKCAYNLEVLHQRNS